MSDIDTDVGRIYNMILTCGIDTEERLNETLKLVKDKFMRLKCVQKKE